MVPVHRKLQSPLVAVFYLHGLDNVEKVVSAVLVNSLLPNNEPLIKTLDVAFLLKEENKNRQFKIYYSGFPP